MNNYCEGYFRKLIPDSDRYYAHLSDQKNTCPELLPEHLTLTVLYAKKIVKQKGLDEVISHLIKELTGSNLDNSKNQLIHEMFWEAIAFHDLGKLNAEFQHSKMHNYQNLLKVRHHFGSEHSIISAYLYLSITFHKILEGHFNDEEVLYLCNIALYMSYPIIRHHSARLGKCQDDEVWCNEKLFDLKPYLSLINLSISEDETDFFHRNFLSNANFNALFDWYDSDCGVIRDYGFPLYALVRLCYSLLTASDYLATAHYMNAWKDTDINVGIIQEALRNKITMQARQSKEYNEQVFQLLECGDFVPDKLLEKSNDNLNKLRTNLAYDALVKVRENPSKYLYYLEAPTGSGKTNVSMLVLSQLLSCDHSLNNVFYVFPFTTLIDQTLQSLQTTLDLQNEEIAAIHSKSPINENHDDNQYLNYLDQLFLNFPVTLLSHVKFFNILTTNEKEGNYLLHRIANSIIIMDELQSYPPAMWDKMMFFISHYAAYFNIRFILMSATLPKIGNLLERNQGDFVYLVDNKKKYFCNPNFCGRLEFDYSLLSWEQPDEDTKDNYLNDLYGVVESKSRDYARSNTINRDSVFTIIEFIGKRTASRFLSIANQNNEFFDSILLLSGTILEPRRKQIIQALKSNDYRRKKILLVTTQVIEAGVDIDMDLGFKDCSLIDSEEQLAGRINRNVRKNNCKLYLFNCDAEKNLYGKDERYAVMTKNKDNSVYEEILRDKDFDRLYNIIIRDIQKQRSSHFQQNINDLYDDIRCLNFPRVADSIKLIDQKSVNVFVPLAIKADLLGDVYSIAISFGLNDKDLVEGYRVWEFYKNRLINQEEDFINNRIQLKQLLTLMSQFSFSIFPKGKDYESLRTFGYEQYGFLYLENYEPVYSFENGINTNVLMESNFF